MLKTIQGTYRDGRIEMDEQPIIKEERKVLITFLPADHKQSGHPISFGMFAKPKRRISAGMLKGARLSTWEDFQEAKKIWEPKNPDE